MKVLIAPLNWGLGHASRCIPLIRQYLAQNAEVVLGGDGVSLSLLRRTFPMLRVIQLAPLQLHYSTHNKQVMAMLRAIPSLIKFSLHDHRLLRNILAVENFDLILSDNRFGFFSSDAHCIYMTHQLHICLPHPWQWLEPMAEWLHACVYRHFSEVWIPDAEQNGLSGILGHPTRLRHPRTRYIGPLSRFSDELSYISSSSLETYDVVAVLSGLEPQRTLFQQDILHQYHASTEKILVVQGLVDQPFTTICKGNITLVPYLTDAQLVPLLHRAKTIIARSGYSTIMDLHTLHLLSKAELHPTPGQPEQEYLASIHKAKSISTIQ